MDAELHIPYLDELQHQEHLDCHLSMEQNHYQDFYLLAELI